MWRKQLLIPCLILCFIGGLAQPGIKIGVSASSFIYHNTPSPYKDFDVDLRPYLGYDIEWVQTGAQKPVLSPYVSLSYTFPLTNRLSVRPELSFIQKGVNFNQSNFERIIYHVRISYLEVPVSLSYRYLNREKVSSAVLVGGYGSVNLHAYKKTAFHHSSIEKTPLHTVNSLNAGMHIGLNVRRTFSSHALLAECRVYYGLKDVFSLPEGQTRVYTEIQTVRHIGLNISMGYEL